MKATTTTPTTTTTIMARTMRTATTQASPEDAPTDTDVGKADKGAAVSPRVPGEPEAVITLDGDVEAKAGLVASDAMRDLLLDGWKPAAFPPVIVDEGEDV